MGLRVGDSGLDLTCDGCGQMSERIIADNVVVALSAAAAGGWLERYTPPPEGKKLWLGPCCSGKRNR